MNIIVVTSTRADFGLLKNLILELKKKFSCKIIASGTHFSKYYGNTFKEIKKSGFKIDYKIINETANDSPDTISNILSKSLVQTSKILSKEKPDLVFLLGDRYEILGSAIASHINRIPIAHIHGGELTYGILDDAFRHSITKLSQLHFVSNKVYKKRVVQLGENPRFVHVVGGMGVDSIKNTKFKSREDLEKELKIKFKKKNIVINFHPETLNKNKASKQIDEIIISLKGIKDASLIFTMPGAELENKIIINKIKKFVKIHSNAYFIKSFGQQNYFSALRICDVVIGNSSSGILEMPTFKKPTINLGERQKGRIKAISVLDVKINNKDIKKALTKIYSKKFLNKIKKSVNPYGNYGSSKKIVKILEKIDLRNILKKEFYDIK